MLVKKKGSIWVENKPYMTPKTGLQVLFREEPTLVEQTCGETSGNQSLIKLEIRAFLKLLFPQV